MNRSELQSLLNTALANGQPDYVREAAQAWLVNTPGDIAFLGLLARAARARGADEAAAGALEAIVAADPENESAQQAFADVLFSLGRTAEAALALACAYVLAPTDEASPQDQSISMPTWVPFVRRGYTLLTEQAWDAARTELEMALLAEPATSLPFLLHLRTFWGPKLYRSAQPLAEAYCARWPNCAAFNLVLAECLLQSNDIGRALDVLHSAVTLDPMGEITARYYGTEHPYQSLWPVPTDSPLPRPLPASLAAALGINRLAMAPGAVPVESTPPAPETAATPILVGGKRNVPATPDTADDESLDQEPGATQETLVDVEAELSRLAARLDQGKADTDSDQGVPAYVALASRSNLQKKYGASGAAHVQVALQNALARIGRSFRWPTVALFVDDAAMLAAFNLQPVDPANAWEIKKLLTDFDAALAKRREMIGAVLIVGGADLVPFHRLPNPTDDLDGDVPSDNPYASRDDNYFIPEWPVGRIPSGKETDPSLLIHLLNGICPTSPSAQASGWFGLLAAIARFFRGLVTRPASRSLPSFGYAANVWKPASLEVFSPIGEPRRLVTSPPVDAARLPPQAFAPARFSYFNLHGVEDGPEWYGQRAPGEHAPDQTPEYPIAIRPSDVVNSGRAPELVFTEACYGGNILDKGVEDAMCLKFLASGTRGVVASTKIAYGSVTAPLIAADLLTKLYWNNVLRGLPLGDALRRAKITLAREMHRRQGYLDGEDQKTLISFVLYGDPLHSPVGMPAKVKRSKAATRRPKTRPLPPAALERPSPADTWRTQLDPHMLAQVKSIVAQYLPGMGTAEIRLWQPTAAAGAKSPAASRRHMVTLAKIHQVQSRAHPQIARLTLDESGKVLKFAISR